MPIRNITHEVFYINFSLIKKLQNLLYGSMRIVLSFQRPIMTLIKNTLRNDVKQTSKMNEIIKQ